MVAAKKHVPIVKKRTYSTPDTCGARSDTPDDTNRIGEAEGATSERGQ